MNIRSSKFKHIEGKPYKREECYENVPITKGANDAPFASVNPKYLAVIIEKAGGGSFLVLPLEEVRSVNLSGVLVATYPNYCWFAPFNWRNPTSIGHPLIHV